MKRVQLTAIPSETSPGALVILSQKDTLDPLEAVLNAEEMAFLRHSSELDSHTFCFPRAASPIFVRLLKHDKSPAIRVENARIAGNSMLRELRHYKITSVRLRNICPEDLSLAFAEGLALGSYQFLKYFSKPEQKEKSLTEICVEGASAASIAELNDVLQAVFLTRDLVNEPYSHMDAPRLAESTLEIARAHGFQATILDKTQLESIQMGGLLAVNKGSTVPPCFCILEWKPAAARNPKPVVLVGKGVVYDTGGLSLKPSEAMDYMKCDMAGGAAVIGLFCAAAANKLPVHLIGLIPVTDNVVGHQAFAPGDVVRMYSGTTVEVVNTDAEGRLLLADALHYAPIIRLSIATDTKTL